MQTRAERRGPSALAGAGLALALATGGVDCVAQDADWRIVPTLAIQETWTDNVNLRRDGPARSDFVTEIAPGLRINVKRPRAEITGTLAAPIVLYARSSGENTVQPRADLVGRLEAIDDFFFVEAAGYVSQQFVSPYGPRPEGLANITDNRYTAATYRVSPYVQGELFGNLRYLVRDDNIWTQLHRSTLANQRVYTNRLTGRIERNPTPIGWDAEVTSAQHEFPDEAGSQKSQLLRGRALYQPDPQWRVFVSGGYERTRVPLNEHEGGIYGLGFDWRPTDRTSVDASWEHRFFGGAYKFRFEHRTRLTSWSIRASRDITSYPEQLARLEPGASLPDILDALFLSRIPDPVERAQAISSYIADRNLPLVVGDPIAIYTQRIQLRESATATAGFLGARNTVLISVYRAKTDPLEVSGDLLPSTFDRINNDTQVGVSIVWTHALTPTASLTLAANSSTAETKAPVAGKSDQQSYRLIVSRPLSPKTSTFAGARYQQQNSDFDRGFHESAVFIGMSHSFR